MPEEIKNYGLIETSEIDPRDWFMGGVTGTQKTVLREDGDWRDLVPEGEQQSALYFDMLNCVTQSAHNCIEIQAKFLGIDINLSDRFTAKASGTTKAGNSLANVADSIARLHGAVKEEEYPFARTQRTPVLDWDDYYQELTPALLSLGLEFLKEWKVEHEWIGLLGVKEALKYGPLQVGVYAWPKKRADGMYDDAGNIRRNHAVTLLYVCDEYCIIFDSYKDENGSFLKKLVPDYNFHWVKQFSLTKLSDKPMPIVNIPSDSIVQLIEAPGGIGFYIEGKIYLAKYIKRGLDGKNLQDENGHDIRVDDGDLVTANHLIRGTTPVVVNGKTLYAFKNPAKLLTKVEWDSFPKFNFKNEEVNFYATPIKQ